MDLTINKTIHDKSHKRHQQKYELTALRNLIDLHQPSAFSGASPFPVVEQMMIRKLATVFKSSFFAPFRAMHLLPILVSASFSDSSTAKLSAFPV